MDLIVVLALIIFLLISGPGMFFAGISLWSGKLQMMSGELVPTVVQTSDVGRGSIFILAGVLATLMGIFIAFAFFSESI